MTEVWAMTSADDHGELQQQPERIVNFDSRVLGKFKGKTIATKTSPQTTKQESTVRKRQGATTGSGVIGPPLLW